MKNIIDKMRKKIFCKKHSNITLSTIEKAQILANGVFTNIHRYSVIKFCKGCKRYYVIKKWTKETKSIRRILGIRL